MKRFILGLCLVGALISRVESPTEVAESLERYVGFELEHLHSKSAYLVERESGKVLLNEGFNQRFYPASMAKVMTAVVVLEKVQTLGERVALDPAMFAVLEAQDAAVAGFSPWDYPTVKDLLYGLLLPSGGECAWALSVHVGGSLAGFAQLMNHKADQLGLKETQFTNPTGLHDTQLFTTAKDLVKLFEYALGNEVFREIVTSPTYVASTGLWMESTMFHGLGRSALSHGRILGGKTGFTEEAGRCLISLAEVEGREYILLTAGARNSPANKTRHLQDALYLYDQIK